MAKRSGNQISGGVTLDITQFNKNVKALDGEIRVVESGFRAASSTLGDWGKTSEGTKLRHQALSKEIELQKQKIEALKGAYDAMYKANKNNTEGLQTQQIKINQASEALGKMQGELTDTTIAFGKATGKMKDNADAAKDNAKAAEGLKKAFSALAGVAAGVVAGVGAIGAGIGKLFLDTAKAADGITEMSDKTGMSVERIQELDFAGKQLGVDLETMTGSNAKLIRSMEAAKKPGSDQANAFAALGVSVTDSNGNLRDSKTVWNETLVALGKMSNETERDAMAMSLMGKNAQELNPLIKASGPVLDGLIQKSHELGAVMSEKDVKAMGDFNDTLDGLKSGLKGTAGTLATAFLPAFQGIADKAGGYLTKFSSIVNSSNGDIGKMASGVGGLLGEIFSDIGKSMPQMLNAGLGILQGILDAIMANIDVMVDGAVKIVMSLVDFILKNLPKFLEAGIKILIALIRGIAEALPTLIPQIVKVLMDMVMILIQNLPLLIQAGMDLLVGLIQGIIGAIPLLVQMLPQIITTLVNMIPQIISSLITTIISNLPQIILAGIQLLIGLVTGLIQAIPELVKMIPQIIIAIVGALIKAAPELWKAAKQIVTSLWDGLKAVWSSLVDAGKNLISGIWEGIKGAANWLWEQIKGFFSGILQKIKDFLGIQSPSTVFAGYGKNMALGLGVGFLGQVNSVGGQLQSGVQKMIAGLSPSLNLNMNAQLAGAGAFPGMGVGGTRETYQFFAPVVLQGAAGQTLGETIKARRY